MNCFVTFRLIPIILLLGAIKVNAQNSTTGKLSSIKGIVIDSLHNSSIPSLTVAVYFKASGKIINFGLTNRFGAFTIDKIPRNVPLKILLSHVSFGQVVKELTIDSRLSAVDLKKIYIVPRINELEEFAISMPPPVKMNGDTLEFNADAFELDSNAVIDDLLRRLPGMTIWSDGKITVNGKEIKGLTVNGKPFFGDDMSIALQNLPKLSVKKIQVYEDKANGLSEPETRMNVVLKEDKNKGFFGKMGAGGGTGKHYMLEGTLNAFDGRSQLSIAAAHNNVNMRQDNMEAMLRNMSYKGNGARVEFEPNFGVLGNLLPLNLAARYLHSFNENENLGFYNRMQLDVSSNKNKLLLDKNTFRITSISDEESLLKKENLKSATVNEDHSINGKYEKKKKGKSLLIKPFIHKKYDSRSDINYIELSSSMKGMLSSSSNKYKSQNEYVQGGFNIEYAYDRDAFDLSNYSKIQKWSYSYKLNYTFSAAESKRLIKRVASLIMQGGASTTDYDRNYNEHGNSLFNEVGITVNGIKARNYNWLNSHNIKFDIYANVKWNNEKDDNYVYDILNEDVKVNNFGLTNNRVINSYTASSGLSMNKSWGQSDITGRSSNWNLRLSLNSQWFYWKSLATQPKQNLSMKYLKFTPKAELSHSKSKTSKFNKWFSITFDQYFTYPVLEQLLPLVDSSVIYYQILGNPNLRETLHNDLKINYTLISSRRSNNYDIRMFVGAGISRDALTDSVYIDSVGRSLIYYSNVNSKYGNASIEASKSFKLNENNRLEFTFNTQASLRKLPSYFNGIKLETLNFGTDTKISTLFNYRDMFSVIMANGIVNNFAKVKGQDRFTTSTIVNSLGAAYKFLEGWSIGSTLSLNYTRSSRGSNNQFNIFNMNVSKRFLKKRNLEMKLSGYDLLNQNKGVLNYAKGNYFVNGDVNVLTRYYMLSISYFPRFF